MGSTRIDASLTIGRPTPSLLWQMKTIQLRVPEVLLLDPLQTLAAVEKRSQFLLALKYFELGQLSSGQSAAMCELSRPAFLLEAGRLGIAVADLSADEMADEFRHV